MTGTSLLIRTDVLQDNGAMSVYSAVILMGLFRTGVAPVMDGYPNILLMRCSERYDDLLLVYIFAIMHMS